MGVKTQWNGGSAVFSDDEVYRYRLDREFWGTEQRAIFLMLNPSTADASKDDPTIRRCIGFAQKWSCAGLTVLNLFALRSRDPKALRFAEAPVGPENERVIKETCEGAVVVCAWGQMGALHGQDKRVLGWLREVGADVSALRVTASGHPNHPLYLPKTLNATPWHAGKPFKELHDRRYDR